ncbi:MAG: FadR/GntR family transcriptional regulator [Oscillospiraceae bacterium]
MPEIKTKSKCDIVTEELLSRIVHGTYKQGERLPTEQQLIAELGVSRVTLRESLKRLDTLGMITIKQGKGTIVNSVGLDVSIKGMLSAVEPDKLDISQLYDARLFVESGMVRLAARLCKKEQLERLKQNQRDLTAAAEATDGVSFSALDAAFHELIAALSGNGILQSAFQTIQEVLHSYIRISCHTKPVMDGSCREHKVILRMIAAGDEEGARVAMEEHILRAKRVLLEEFNRMD